MRRVPMCGAHPQPPVMCGAHPQPSGMCGVHPQPPVMGALSPHIARWHARTVGAALLLPRPLLAFDVLIGTFILPSLGGHLIAPAACRSTLLRHEAAVTEALVVSFPLGAIALPVSALRAALAARRCALGRHELRILLAITAFCPPGAVLMLVRTRRRRRCNRGGLRAAAQSARVLTARLHVVRIRSTLAIDRPRLAICKLVRADLIVLEAAPAARRLQR